MSCMTKCLFCILVVAVILLVFTNDDITLFCIRKIYFVRNNERTDHFQEHLLHNHELTVLCVFSRNVYFKCFKFPAVS